MVFAVKTDDGYQCERVIAHGSCIQLEWFHLNVHVLDCQDCLLRARQTGHADAVVDDDVVAADDDDDDDDDGIDGGNNNDDDDE